MPDTTIKSGDRFRWVGLPGQYENDDVIQVDSLAASCVVNARIVNDSKAVALISIPAADLLAAIGAGWLVPMDRAGSTASKGDVDNAR